MPRSRSRKRKSSAGWLCWWPLALAIVATPFAVRAASVLALSGPVALQLLYPSVAALQRLHSLTPGQQDVLASILLWVQFPLYGLVLSLFGRWRRWFTGLVLAVLLHAAFWCAASWPLLQH